MVNKPSSPPQLEVPLESGVNIASEIEKLLVIPGHYFAAAAAECYELHIGKHYYGCISLVQAVAETLVKFLCEINEQKISKNFDENLNRLQKQGVITQEVRAHFTTIWVDRNDYHHLNKQVKREYQELTSKAKTVIICLNEIEHFFFDHTFREGAIIPEKPTYWKEVKDGRSDVFLRMG